MVADRLSLTGAGSLPVRGLRGVGGDHTVRLNCRWIIRSLSLIQVGSVVVQGMGPPF